MYLAVKFADDTNKKKLPVGYPCLCRELQDDVPCPEGYQKMTVAEVEELKVAMRPSYEQFLTDLYNPKIKKLNKLNRRLEKIHLEIKELEKDDEEDRNKNRWLALKKEHKDLGDLIAKTETFEEV